MNATKFLSPKTVKVLERERLLQRLAAWEDKKLVLIHAQAGQGKSTLAAGFVQTLSHPSLWYNLDQEDDNPEVFLSCLGRAISETWPDRMPNVPPVPRNRYGISQGLTPWISQVFGNLPDPSWIILDDYVDTSFTGGLQNLLKLLLVATPPNIKFLVLSRVRPEIEIARLRATQSMGELIGDDLIFTDAEVQELFGIVFGMQISQTEAALINATAEGWPAGLVLMHEYLAGLSPQARALAIADKRSSVFRTHVFDYLAQEVFVHLRPDMQRFLLRTSVADYLSSSLMEILAGLPASASPRKPSIASMVAELRRRNLFVSATDEPAPVIRYHALFRDFLRRKLVAQTKPSEVKRLYREAAAFFKRSGDPVRSIDLQIASGQFDQAIRQIEACGEDLIGRGQSRTLVRWIEALPLEFGNRPWFLYYRAVASRFTDPRTALNFYDLALRRFRAHPTGIRRMAGLMLSLCGVIETCFYAGGNFKRMARAASASKALLRQTSRESIVVRARLLLALGTACFFLGRLRQGAAHLKEALESFRRVRDHYHEIQGAIYLAPCAIYLGDFRLAREAIQKGFEAHQLIPEETGGKAALFMALAMTALFEGRFTEARQSIDQCHALAREHELEAFDFLSLDIGGWLKTATEEYEAAEQLLKLCKSKGEESGNAFFASSASHLLALTYLHLNRLDEAEYAAKTALAVRSQSGSRLFSDLSLAVFGAVTLKRGRTAKAERLLARSLALFRRTGAAQQEANVLLLLARLSLEKGKVHEARRFLTAGFSLGRDRGFTYYCLLTRDETVSLARTAIHAGICPDYCSALLSGNGDPSALPFVRICCLGGFRAFKGDAQLSDREWKSPRAKSLLKLLSVQESKPLSHDAVFEALWHDRQPDSPSHAFNSLVHRIRRVLDPEGSREERSSCILHADGVVALNAEHVWTDTGQFTLHLKAAKQLTLQQRFIQAAEEYGKAFELYQGDFLPEDTSADWTAPVRDRLRMQFLLSLEEGAGAAEFAGDREISLAFYERLHMADPCNENACRWLMTRYHSDGRRADAVRTYERCERSLSRDLDAEPEAETRRIFQGIIGG